MIKKQDSERLTQHFPDVDWNKLFWGFTCYSRQDYAGRVPLDAAEDEIMLGIQQPDGGCLAEFGFRWYKLNGELVPKLEVFSDAWLLLRTDTFQNVINQLTRDKKPLPTPDELSALLITWGFIDQSDNPLAIPAGNPFIIPAMTESGAAADAMDEGKDNV